MKPEQKQVVKLFQEHQKEFTKLEAEELFQETELSALHCITRDEEISPDLLSRIIDNSLNEEEAKKSINELLKKAFDQRKEKSIISIVKSIGQLEYQIDIKEILTPPTFLMTCLTLERVAEVIFETVDDEYKKELLEKKCWNEKDDALSLAIKLGHRKLINLFVEFDRTIDFTPYLDTILEPDVIDRTDSFQLLFEKKIFTEQATEEFETNVQSGIDQNEKTLPPILRILPPELVEIFAPETAEKIRFLDELKEIKRIITGEKTFFEQVKEEAKEFFGACFGLNDKEGKDVPQDNIPREEVINPEAINLLMENEGSKMEENKIQPPPPELLTEKKPNKKTEQNRLPKLFQDNPPRNLTTKTPKDNDGHEEEEEEKNFQPEIQNHHQQQPQQKVTNKIPEKEKQQEQKSTIKTANQKTPSTKGRFRLSNQLSKLVPFGKRPK